MLLQNVTAVSEVCDMKERIITASIAIPIGILVLVLHKTFLFPLFTAVIAAVSVYELLNVCDCSKFKGHLIMCLSFAVSMPVLAYYRIDYIWRLFVASLLVFLMFTGYVLDHKKLPFNKLSIMITSTTLVSLSVTCLVSLRNMSDIHGICYVVMALMIAWIPDAGAYFVGTALGKHKLCPDISPKKTIEGAVGGLVVSAVVFALFGLCYQQIMLKTKGIEFSVNYPAIIIIAVIGVFISMIGDLSASLLKREYEIKDYGNILPGHGGFVDRFDSVYFVLPYAMLVFSAVKVYY